MFPVSGHLYIPRGQTGFKVISHEPEEAGRGEERPVKVMDRTRADSSVQGPILLLAVSVIIATIISSYAMGVVGNLQKGKTVAAIASQMDNDIIVTWYGGPENDAVSFYNVTLRDTDILPGTVPGYPPVVGNSTLFPGYGTDGLDHVVVVAYFTDGAAQIILDTYV